MKGNTVLAIIWAASAFAIAVGIIVTKSADPLWTLLIPALVTGNYNETDNKKESDE